MLRQGWGERPNVRILFGRWQDVLPQLLQGGPYTGIFFDTYGQCLSGAHGARGVARPWPAFSCQARMKVHGAARMLAAGATHLLAEPPEAGAPSPLHAHTNV